MKTAEYYHCRLQVIGRGNEKRGSVRAGRAAVACAAYRAGMAIADERYGVIRDFSRKSDVVTSCTFAPDGAPDWASDVTQLWNRVEASEKRKDAQLAYEWEIALPNELDAKTREEIARSFAGFLKENYGVAGTVGIHSGGERGNGLNDHMHVMMTRRGVNADGFDKKILQQFSVKPGAPNPEVERVREHVANLINDALEEAGSDERVDHRSFRARGIDREPTRHLGPAATAYERQGFETDRGDINREIIEERVRWQMDEAQPEITADLERQLAARFGDDFAAVVEQAQAGGAVPDIETHARQDTEPMRADVEQSGREDFAAKPQGWRAHLRRLHDNFREFWRDETSGEPGERGILARTVDAGRELWAGITRHDAASLAHGIEDAADVASELAGDETGGAPSGGLWQALVRAERALEKKARELLGDRTASVPRSEEQPADEPGQALWNAMQEDDQSGDDAGYEPPDLAPQTAPDPPPEPDNDPDMDL